MEGSPAGLSSPALLTKGWRGPWGRPWEGVYFICFCSGTSLANCLASPWLEIWGSSMLGFSLSFQPISPGLLIFLLCV